MPLALTVYNYKPEQQKRAGAPVEPLYLSPVVALGYGSAVARCAPHPTPALLFNEFMLGDALDIWAKRDMALTNPKVLPLPPGDFTMIDPAEMLDNRAKWEELWSAPCSSRSEARFSFRARLTNARAATRWAPSPLVGEGWGEGTLEKALRANPSPQPSPAARGDGVRGTRAALVVTTVAALPLIPTQIRFVVVARNRGRRPCRESRHHERTR